MEFSRAVLAAAVSVLGLLFYVVAGLLTLLAIVAWLRADRQAPLGPTLLFAGLFTFAGLTFRFVSRRIA